MAATLSAIAAPALRANHIDFITTSTIVSPADNSNFLPDGHFTPAANEKIARAMLALLGRVSATRCSSACSQMNSD